jgi:hypothetical protein
MGVGVTRQSDSGSVGAPDRRRVRPVRVALKVKMMIAAGEL